MITDTGVIVAVASDRGQFVHVRLNDHVRQRCSQLGSIPPEAKLPDVYFKPFHVVLAYLDGDELLSVFASHIGTADLLLVFAQAWALAARLSLPKLQNKLISLMAKLHIDMIDGESKGMEKQYTADDNLSHAIQHLQHQFGPGSPAENFLTCFIGRTTPLICELERRLASEVFDDDIRMKILTEARSFERDPIKHRPHVFYVEVSDRPRYPPLLVEQRPPGKGPVSDAGSRSIRKTPSYIFLENNDPRPSSSREDQSTTCDVFVDKIKARSSSGKRAPRPCRATARWDDSRAGPGIRMPPGKPRHSSRYDSSQRETPEEEQSSTSEDSFVTANEWPNEARRQVCSPTPPRPAPPPTRITISTSQLPQSRSPHFPNPRISTRFRSISRHGPPQTPHASSSSASREYHHHTRHRCIIEIHQHNANDTGNSNNGNRTHDDEDDNNATTAIPHTQASHKRGKYRIPLFAVNNNSHRYPVRREGDQKVDGKRCRFFSLFTYGSKCE